MSSLGDLCNCRAVCGDADDEYGTCKGLRRPPSPPLVEVVLVPRRPRPDASTTRRGTAMGRTRRRAFVCRLGYHQPYVEPFRGCLPDGFVEDYGTVEFDGITRFTYSGPVRRYCGACGDELPGHIAEIGDRAMPEAFTATRLEDQ